MIFLGGGIMKKLTKVLLVIFVFLLTNITASAITQNEIQSKISAIISQYTTGDEWDNSGSLSFANHIFETIFNCSISENYTADTYHLADEKNVVPVGSITNPTSDKLKNLFKNVIIGDVLVCCGSVAHTMIVTGISDVGITVLDADFYGNNEIRANALMSYSSIANKFNAMSIYRYKNYDIISVYTASILEKSQNSYTIKTKISNTNNGNLIVVGYKNKLCVAVETTSYIEEIVSSTLIGDFDEFKIMLWDNLHTMKPLCDAEVIFVDKK